MTNHSNVMGFVGDLIANRFQSGSKQQQQQPTKKKQSVCMSLMSSNSSDGMSISNTSQSGLTFQKQFKMAIKNTRAINNILHSTTNALSRQTSEEPITENLGARGSKVQNSYLPPVQSKGVSSSLPHIGGNKPKDTTSTRTSISSLGINGGSDQKQERIDGQIKKYMTKMGLMKKDVSPTFFMLDENGYEVKTSFAKAGGPSSTAAMIASKRKSISSTSAVAVQHAARNDKASFHVNNNRDDDDDDGDKQSNGGRQQQQENLDEIMKICNQLHKTIASFDKKNARKAKRTDGDFRKLNGQIKQLDLENLLIDDHEDPVLQPYFQQIKQDSAAVGNRRPSNKLNN